MHGGVQGLHPPVERLGEAGELTDLGHGQPGVGERRCCGAGGDQGDTSVGQGPAEVDQPGLVGDTE